MAFASHHAVVVILGGLELFVNNSHAILDAQFMVNVRTALVSARKDGMANTVRFVSLNLIYFFPPFLICNFSPSIDSRLREWLFTSWSVYIGKWRISM
jgi:hypothetical protein